MPPLSIRIVISGALKKPVSSFFVQGLGSGSFMSGGRIMSCWVSVTVILVPRGSIGGFMLQLALLAPVGGVMKQGRASRAAPI